MLLPILLAVSVLSAGSPSGTVDERIRTLVNPVRIVWTSQSTGYGGCTVEHADALLRGEPYCSTLPQRPVPACKMVSNSDTAAVLVDFGRELHGGVKIGVGGFVRRHRIRVRFGESAAEAMADLGEKAASNDHATRDVTLEVPSFGSLEFGLTGFRFVRIDLLTPGEFRLQTLQAVSVERRMERLGSFRCSDGRLNAIYETAVRTAHLCCQDQLWDGIKRDRLVWMGDTHPETMTLLSAFGRAQILPETLEFIARYTPPDKWMNGMPTYTLWWLRNVYEWYLWTADRDWLAGHAGYIKATLDNVLANVTPAGEWGGGPGRGYFLDHQSGRICPEGQKDGAQGLFFLALRDSKVLMEALGDADRAAKCDAAMGKLRALPRLDPRGLKQAAAMLALSGLREPKEMFAESLGTRGHAGTTTFMGYYLLEGMSAAGEHGAAMRLVRDYWGGMLDLGATSFWEDFDLAWTNGVARIDELPKPGQGDVHADNGQGTCYVGYRHSFCHGWESGPAPWLVRHVLGVEILEPGASRVRVMPYLGDLAWAEGEVPLAKGILRLRHEKRADGTISTKILNCPEGVKLETMR